MKSPIRFSSLLQAFFTQRLMQQKQVSSHTIESYRDTFRLLLKFIQKRRHKQPASLLFEDIDAPLICAFLDDLQKQTGYQCAQPQCPARRHPLLLSPRSL